jgi:hypothetical protein
LNVRISYKGIAKGSRDGSLIHSYEEYLMVTRIMSIFALYNVNKHSMPVLTRGLSPCAPGMTVRKWLNNKTFEEQYQYGLDVLKRHGY